MAGKQTVVRSHQENLMFQEIIYERIHELKLKRSVPAQSGSVRHKRGRGWCRVVPVRLGAAGPLGLEELAEVEWVQCWVSSV